MVGVVGTVGTGVGAPAVGAPGAGVVTGAAVALEVAEAACCAARGRDTWVGARATAGAAWVAEAADAGAKEDSTSSARWSEACAGVTVRIRAARLGAAGAACRVWPSTRSPEAWGVVAGAGPATISSTVAVSWVPRISAAADATAANPSNGLRCSPFTMVFPRVRLSRVPVPAPREYGHNGQPETLVYPSRLLV